MLLAGAELRRRGSWDRLEFDSIQTVSCTGCLLFAPAGQQSPMLLAPRILSVPTSGGSVGSALLLNLAQTLKPALPARHQRFVLPFLVGPVALAAVRVIRASTHFSFAEPR